jgi:hypothetical protein
LKTDGSNQFINKDHLVEEINNVDITNRQDGDVLAWSAV